MWVCMCKCVCMCVYTLEEVQDIDYLETTVSYLRLKKEMCFIRYFLKNQNTYRP